MNIWSEMMTALRGGIDELGESMKTSQAIEILEQQIILITKELQLSKEHLAQSLIKQKQAEQQVKLIKAEIEKYESYAVKALEQDESLALEVAEQIAILENEFAEQEIRVINGIKDCEKFRRVIRQAEQNLQRAKQQLDTVKASTNVQTVQESMSLHTEGSTTKLKTARDVLERLKKQTNSEDAIKEDLQTKLLKAGIIGDGEEANASAVLTRIKEKNKLEKFSKDPSSTDEES